MSKGMVSSLMPWMSMRLIGVGGRSPNPIKGAPATGATDANMSLKFTRFKTVITGLKTW